MGAAKTWNKFRMKLISSFLVGALGYAQQNRPTPKNPDQCFAKNTDIDGNFGRRNVVEDFENVYSAEACQNHCKSYRSQGCKYFVWEKNDFECTLYNDLGELEHDEDEQEKYVGEVDGCLPCFRQGWDYIVDRAPRNNLVGAGHVASVANIFNCAKLCKYSSECTMVSFNQVNGDCYLKNQEAVNADAVFDKEFQTAQQICANNRCVLQNRNYENGYFTRYDIITRKVSGSIPGVATPADCQTMCRNVKECGFWTWDRDDNNCYLVKSDYWLEYSEDKVSGSRDCAEETQGQDFFGMQNFGSDYYG